MTVKSHTRLQISYGITFFRCRYIIIIHTYRKKDVCHVTDGRRQTMVPIQTTVGPAFVKIHFVNPEQSKSKSKQTVYPLQHFFVTTSKKSQQKKDHGHEK